MKNLSRYLSLRFSVVLLYCVGFAACNGTQNGNEQTDVSISSSSENGQKVALADASHEQLAPHIVECQGSQVCVQICHRPPGNPTNSKDMVLPLRAALAHLDHGGDHEMKDYLGFCSADDSGGELPGDDQAEGDEGAPVEDPANEDPVSDDPPGDVSELPLWCQEFLNVDSDCDGYYDSTGLPIF
ncbi:MAG: hypothetical protein AB7N80_02020 [Bdellovibrionales bacterium]